MSKILVTGANGFVGKNVISVLKTLNHEISTFDKENSLDDLAKLCKNCEFVIHLAGVNRPENTADFYTGNFDLTNELCKLLESNKNPSPIILSSSIQAALDNDYGKSKKQAEDRLIKHSKKNSSPVYIFRFRNLYGKWSRPNYNSVIATWCYNISHGLDIIIDDSSKKIDLCYIDDVVSAIILKLDGKAKTDFYEVTPTDMVSLGEIRDLLVSFKDSRIDFSYPQQTSRFAKNLYATYISYFDTKNFSYPLLTKSDDRGSFTEILKSQTEGQVSVNISKPGITKGQHWHSTKNEKFLVVHGQGVIRFRNVFNKEIVEYKVSGDRLEVVDIPTGYTHNIENLGKDDMVTIIWASELLNPDKPDTNYEEV